MSTHVPISTTATLLSQVKAPSLEEVFNRTPIVTSQDGFGGGMATDLGGAQRALTLDDATQQGLMERLASLPEAQREEVVHALNTAATAVVGAALDGQNGSAVVDPSSHPEVANAHAVFSGAGAGDAQEFGVAMYLYSSHYLGQFGRKVAATGAYMDELRALRQDLSDLLESGFANGTETVEVPTIGEDGSITTEERTITRAEAEAMLGDIETELKTLTTATEHDYFQVQQLQQMQMQVFQMLSSVADQQHETASSIIRNVSAG